MILTSDQILDQQLVTGDHYRLTYRAGLPAFKNFQAQLVADRLKKAEPRIGNLTARAVGDLLVVDFDVVKNPFPLVAVLGVFAGVLSSLFLFNVSLERVEKIAKTPLGMALAAAIAVVAVILAVRYIRGGSKR